LVTYPNGAEETNESVPNRKQNPFPKHSEIEVQSLLACLVDLGVLVDVLIVDILNKMQVRNNSYLFHCICEKTLERRPKSIVERRQIFGEKDLA
jgi:hypothetical protein